MKHLILSLALLGCTTQSEDPPTTLTTAPDAPELIVFVGPSASVCMTASEWQREVTWKAAIRGWVNAAELELGIKP